MNTKDYNILKHIINYCDEIKTTQNEFNNDRDRFIASATFRNAICLCLLQIEFCHNILIGD